jgi:hypothetical protein
MLSSEVEEKRRGTMRKVIWLLAGIAFFMMADKAMAQEGGAPAGGGGSSQYAEKTEYTFDDDVVTGDLVRPDGELTVVRKKGKQRSLIKVRQHFIPEMLKSVEDI